MSDTVIKVENLSKEYRLGVVGHDTLYRDLQSWWAKVRGKEDPNSLLGAHPSPQTPLPATRRKGLASHGGAAATTFPSGDAPLSKAGEREDNELKKHFLALNDVSFEVKQGDVLGIIGRNGAGKSTLLKILSRITSPSAGEIKIKGRLASLLEVGTGFHSELTGRQNVYMNGAILGMRRHEIRSKMDEIIAFSGVEKFIDTPVKRYSSGMMVRLAFSVASNLDAEILVIDEVLAVGDASFQQKCLGKMNDVAKNQGRTVLFVSHNMAAIKSLCSRCILIEQGSLDKTGSPNEIVLQYLKRNSPEKNQGVIDLSKIIRSSGSQKGAIKRAWIEDELGNIVNTFPMGSKIKFCFYFEARNILANPAYGIAFSDSYGNQIFAGGSISVKKETHHAASVKKGTVVFEYDVFPLSPGLFNVSFGLDDTGDTVDLIDNVMQFEISENDYFGNGKIYLGRYGMVFAENKLYLRETGV